MSVAFDTLRAARRLRDEGGFDEMQAGTLVATFAEGMGETLATKADVSALRSDLEKMETAFRSDLEKTETALRSEMEKLEQRMTIRLGGMMVVGLGIVVALLKLL